MNYTKNLNQIIPKTLKTKKWEGDIIFLYKVIDGVSENSFGLHVAKIAGINSEVIKKASKYLDIYQEKTFEKKKDTQKENANVHENYDNLNNLIRILKKINIDNITPRQAMDVLYNLKNISQ